MFPINSLFNFKKDKPKQYVGCVRNPKKPNEFHKLLAKACAHYGLTMIYYTPKQVDMENHLVTGKILINDKWHSKVVNIPVFNDVATLCFRHKEVTNYLRQMSTLSNDLIGTKTKQYRLIKSSDMFKDIVIPYITTNQPENIMNFLAKHSTIILKPSRGMKGENIYKVTKLENGEFLCVYQTEEKRITYDEFYQFLYSLISKKKYICQKYIETIDENGKPFDVRIRLEKNVDGEWETVVNLVRIAGKQKVVSNVAQGGYVAELSSFLQVNYPDNLEKINKKIIQIGENLPLHIEETTGKNLSSLGIDVGIDPHGSIYLFEINTSPGTEFAIGEIALIKSGYFHHKMKELSNQRLKTAGLSRISK
ncbi:YheC/YheD family protein [Gracilibacillus sp. S3-1-1]|uniref:YheC/YheD family protein n=1 Tax=Gracilibacillus pellucidus TaxID=3095368 RepID=A0ACC6M4S1_9BACI|nr:YheC/YheD family protein [Gracilibacillus sp. S3-1-1]MDX8045908.1 YheC/YheD family protein [Gracilibacillus sp. S3-1-1]